MVPGYLAGGARTNWVDRIGWFDAAVWKGEPIIPMVDTFPTPHLRGWRCTSCRLLLIDYGAGVVHFDSPSEKAKSR